MRPLYESAHDRMNESNVSDTLSSAWKCKFVKLPISYHVDWMLLRNNEIVAFAELKTRKVSSTQYPTLILSLNKWMKGLDLANTTGKPFIIIAKWTDGIFYFFARPDGVTFGYGGRIDRNDSQDMEPVAFINTKNFIKVKE
jgi:hypothetical protein